jgi:hypothetical protein
MESGWSFRLSRIQSWSTISKDIIFWTLKQRRWVRDIDRPPQECFGVIWFLELDGCHRDFEVEVSLRRSILSIVDFDSVNPWIAQIRIRGSESRSEDEREEKSSPWSHGHALKMPWKRFAEKEMAISREMWVDVENERMAECKRKLYDGKIDLRSPSQSECSVRTIHREQKKKTSILRGGKSKFERRRFAYTEMNGLGGPNRGSTITHFNLTPYSVFKFILLKRRVDHIPRPRRSFFITVVRSYRLSRSPITTARLPSRNWSSSSPQLRFLLVRFRLFVDCIWTILSDD